MMTSARGSGAQMSVTATAQAGEGSGAQAAGPPLVGVVGAEGIFLFFFFQGKKRGEKIDADSARTSA